MPVVQLDWEKIKSRFAGGTQFFVLTDQQAALLLSLSEQLTWDKTYKVEDYDFADRDTLEAEVADTQRNLMMGVDITDLIGYIDEVETLLRDLKTLTSNQCCPGDEFDGGGNTDDVEDGVGDVPQNIIDAGYATDAADWDGFDDYKCLISTLIVEDAIGKSLKFSQLYDIQGAIIGGTMAIIGIITFLITGGTLAILGGILAAAGASLGLWELLAEAGEETMETMHTNMVAAKDDFVCAVYTADGPTAGIAALYAEYDVQLSAVEAAIARLFNSLSIFRAMYGGRYNQVDVAERLADLGYDVADFTCDCAEPIVLTQTFDSDTEGWTAGSCWFTWLAGGYARLLAASTAAWGHAQPETSAQVASRYSLTYDIMASAIEFDFRFVTSGSEIRQEARVYLIDEADGQHGFVEADAGVIESDVVGYGSWNTYSHTFASPVSLKQGGAPLWGISHYRYSAQTAGQRGEIDNLRIYGEHGV